MHALELELPVGEVATPYYSRPRGSRSKLNTAHDGFRILWTVLKLYRAERPLALFGSLGIALGIMAVGLAIPIFVTYVEEGLGAALADGGAVDRPQGARQPVGRRRADARYGDARPARDEDDRLSGAPRAGRRPGRS